MVQHKVHHDSRTYEVANKESAEKARAKLQARFDAGKLQVEDVLTRVQNEVPADYLVPSKKIGFGLDDRGIIIDIPKPGGGSDNVGIHGHAMGQLSTSAGIPWKYAQTLQREDPHWLVANLERRYHKAGDTATGGDFKQLDLFKQAQPVKVKDKHLARVVNGQLLGWLSDHYRRDDESALAQAFVKNVLSLGAVPVEGRHMTTRFALKFMIPQVYEPIEDEVLAFGLSFSTSGFKDGALDVRGFICRTWCTNDCMSEESFRKIHRGPRLESHTFSDATLEKQTAMYVSAIGDVVKSIAAPEAIKKKLDFIKKADEEEISVKEALDAMKKRSTLSNDEVDRVTEILTSSDTEVLPPVRGVPHQGKVSKWRFGNALSFLGGELANRRGLELQMMSGDFLGLQAN